MAPLYDLRFFFSSAFLWIVKCSVFYRAEGEGIPFEACVRALAGSLPMRKERRFFRDSKLMCFRDTECIFLGCKQGRK